MATDLPRMTQAQTIRAQEERAREDMYNKQFKSNEVWGIDGYEPGQKYYDANKIAKDREYNDLYKKPYNLRPKPPRATKRGHFLEDLAKQTNPKVGMIIKFKLIGPPTYKLEREWVTKEMIEKGKRAPKKTDKNTFIDQIFKEQKLRHVPGVGKYHVVKPLEEVKKELDEIKKTKIKQGEKISHFDDFKFISNHIPGPGHYNPHNLEKNEIVKLKMNTTKPDFWIKKHKDERSKTVKSSWPDVGTYKNNHPVDYTTFGKQLHDQKDAEKGAKGLKNWGTDERFHDPKKTKSNTVLNVPGPGQYQLVAKWPGKQEKKDENKKKNWMNNLTRGVSKSIYY